MSVSISLIGITATPVKFVGDQLFSVYSKRGEDITRYGSFSHYDSNVLEYKQCLSSASQTVYPSWVSNGLTADDIGVIQLKSTASGQFEIRVHEKLTPWTALVWYQVVNFSNTYLKKYPVTAGNASQYPVKFTKTGDRIALDTSYEAWRQCLIKVLNTGFNNNPVSNIETTSDTINIDLGSLTVAETYFVNDVVRLRSVSGVSMSLGLTMDSEYKIIDIQDTRLICEKPFECELDYQGNGSTTVEVSPIGLPVLNNDTTHDSGIAFKLNAGLLGYKQNFYYVLFGNVDGYSSSFNLCSATGAVNYNNYQYLSGSNGFAGEDRWIARPNRSFTFIGTKAGFWVIQDAGVSFYIGAPVSDNKKLSKNLSYRYVGGEHSYYYDQNYYTCINNLTVFSELFKSPVSLALTHGWNNNYLKLGVNAIVPGAESSSTTYSPSLIPVTDATYQNRIHFTPIIVTQNGVFGEMAGVLLPNYDTTGITDYKEIVDNNGNKYVYVRVRMSTQVWTNWLFSLSLSNWHLEY